MTELAGRKVRIHHYVMRNTTANQQQQYFYSGEFAIFVGLGHRSSATGAETVAIVLLPSGMLETLPLSVVQFLDADELFGKEEVKNGKK